MPDFHRVTLLQKLGRALRDLDARLEHNLHSLGERLQEGLWQIRHFSDKLEPSDVGRAVVTLACEGLTYLALGGVVMTALAKPAFVAVNEESWLKQQDIAATFTDAAGTIIGRRGILHSNSVPLDELPEHLVKAVLATEDRRFFEHFGIDLSGLFRALVANARANGVVQGGSTITQQLAKNLFLNNERSLERKIKEAFLAFWLETHLSKQEILKLYLDRAYMGSGTFGVQAAAEHYFGKDVRDISLAEAAMLAGLFKAPTKYSPNVNMPAARARAADVLSNMVEARFLTEGQIAAALRNPATPVERQTDNAADYALDFGFEEVKQLAVSGKLGNARVLTVRSTIDRGLQRQAERVTEAVLRQHGPVFGVKQSALVVLDHRGGLKAMVGGRDYGHSQFNRATQALRAPGSSFKPYVYAAALEAGVIKPTSMITDRPTCIGNWCPSNYGRSFAGSMPATVALAKSINTTPVQLTQMLDPRDNKRARQRVIAMTQKLGFSHELRDMVSLPIGSSEVTVVDMATGFAGFASGGLLTKPFVALEIATSSGDVIYRADTSLEQRPRVLPQTVAHDMNFMLSKVITEGTGRRAILPGIPAAGKTGTTDEYRNAWFVGYTGNFTTAVWFGNDDFRPTQNMTGGSLPAMTFAQVMAYAHLDVELRPLPGLSPEETPVRDPKLQDLAGVVDMAAPNVAPPGRLTPRGRAILREIESLVTAPPKDALSVLHPSLRPNL